MMEGMVQNRVPKNTGYMTGEQSNWKQVNYRSVFFLFFFGSFAGFLMEGIWAIIRRGQWENHSSLIWGPFCMVYGLGAVLMYLASFPLSRKPLLVEFVGYALLGTVAEYVSSLIQEYCVGSVSWNYSQYILNIGGRVCLFMSLLWGAIGLAFGHLLFPKLKEILTACTGGRSKYFSIVLTIFMLANVLATSAAVLRWRERIHEDLPNNPVEAAIDEAYDNETMESIFGNMVFL